MYLNVHVWSGEVLDGTARDPATDETKAAHYVWVVQKKSSFHPSNGNDLAGICKTYLVLDKKLDTLNRSSGSLRDGGGDTTHCYKVSIVHLPVQQLAKLAARQSQS
jgi:hypothetical protein